MSGNRLQVLSTYRRLLQTIKLIPDKRQRTTYLHNIKTSFRNYAYNSTEQDFEPLMKKANEQLKFLQMLVPRSSKSTSAEGKQVYSVIGGKLVNLTEEKAKLTTHEKGAISNFGPGNIDPDALARHEYLMRRMRFEEGPLKDYPKNVWGIGK
jgi:hypothetical protein